MIYLIGSLRNPEIPTIAYRLREVGFEVFDDWYAAGPEADDYWRDYEKGRGRTLPEALKGHAASHVYYFDKEHLEEADTVILVMPAGKSAFLELGWALGKGKRGYILLDTDPERYDVMFKFATGVTSSLDELIQTLVLLNPQAYLSKMLFAHTETTGKMPTRMVSGKMLYDAYLMSIASAQRWVSSTEIGFVGLRFKSLTYTFNTIMKPTEVVFYD